MFREELDDALWVPGELGLVFAALRSVGRDRPLGLEAESGSLERRSKLFRDTPTRVERAAHDEERYLLGTLCSRTLGDFRHASIKQPTQSRRDLRDVLPRGEERPGILNFTVVLDQQSSARRRPRSSGKRRSGVYEIRIA